MPKLGRRSETSQVEYMFNNKGITRHAPFGTADTPTLRVKIIGGKPVTVYEDGKTPRGDGLKIDPGYSPRKLGQVSPSRGSSRASNQGPMYLSPLTEKPNNFDPTPFIINSNKNQKNILGYVSAQQDGHNSQLHTQSPVSTARNLNPHPVVPPIPEGRVEYNPPPQTSNPAINKLAMSEEGNSRLIKYLPKDTYLPKQPIMLSKDDELELRTIIHNELQGFDGRKLKDVYLELTGFDRNLIGSVSYQTLGFALLKGQVSISALSLRLLSAMFLHESRQEWVNYEKVLSFIGACLKDPTKATEPPRQGVSPMSPRHEMGKENPNVPDHYYNIITHQEEDYSQGSKKFPYQDRDNAKLLRLIENQLLMAEEELDFERIWDVFRVSDRDHRGKLSREQIKELTYACRIPLQESLVDQIISRCDSSNGQFDWQQYLEFIERVQPLKTGLDIPESKKPTEYFRHMPEPTQNWPKQSPRATPPRPQQERRSGDTSRSRNGNVTLGSSKDHQIQNLEKELKQLEDAYKKIEQEQVESKPEPWFERFMKMADDIYRNDTDSSGFLPVTEMKWLIHDGNGSYHLHLSNEVISDSIKQCTSGDKVAIAPLLKLLGVRGP